MYTHSCTCTCIYIRIFVSFLQSGCSKNGNPVFYFIARKFKGDQLQTSYQLLYHIMLLLKSSTERSFEIVLDLTQTSQHNEPDVSQLYKYKYMQALYGIIWNRELSLLYISPSTSTVRILYMCHICFFHFFFPVGTVDQVCCLYS